MSTGTDLAVAYLQTETEWYKVHVASNGAQSIGHLIASLREISDIFDGDEDFGFEAAREVYELGGNLVAQQTAATAVLRTRAEVFRGLLSNYQ